MVGKILHIHLTGASQGLELTHLVIAYGIYIMVVLRKGEYHGRRETEMAFAAHHLPIF